MNRGKRAVLYAGGGLAFGLCFLLMLYYGKETFYVEGTKTVSTVYDYHVVLLVEETGNEYWRMVEKHAQQTAEEHDIYLESIGPEKADRSEMLRTMDQMIAAEVDGILTQGLPGPRFRNLVEKAEEKGIPVLTVDSDRPDSERSAYIGTDNVEAGRLAGEELLRATEGEQHVGIITGNLESLNQKERIRGFEEAVAGRDRVEVVAVRESNISEVGAAEAAYTMIKQHSDINALFGTSALDGIGMVQGVEDIKVEGRPYMLAFDILPETMKLLEEGRLDATIAQYPERMGEKGIEIMIEVLEEGYTDPVHHTKTKVIRRGDGTS
ncbi:sugar-binding protein [Salibacterium halotolerans]|uniref:Ribose transport system substrate-binding protein n=1 Tax=Salibacterium halotolerans TaxID=1884432 RepID=A0A1I5LIY5_9BACI|nr:sugar-binding protein [Salibacterium halotolerans]SFO97270.1 ribose transport system substrate-binding protein [Salibacterium halotolerans]